METLKISTVVDHTESLFYVWFGNPRVFCVNFIRYIMCTRKKYAMSFQNDRNTTQCLLIKSIYGYMHHFNLKFGIFTYF